MLVLQNSTQGAAVQRFVRKAWCGLAGWIILSVSFARCEGEEIGISKEKPTSGPYVQIESGFMVPYTTTIPGTSASFEMIPIPGGKFKMGSPEAEEGRTDEEGPVVEVSVDPFWMGKLEVTWSEYQQFMRTYNVFKQLKSAGIRKVSDANRIDAITVPTPLYEPSHTFEFGDDPALPAVTMTQYAAKQYTKWLSGLTGLQYRLPTEAEWERAARGGKTTAYSFGEDPSMLADFANFQGNSESGPSKVGLRKPNPFGLYDIHGNVWEWTLDAFTPEGYQAISGKSLTRATAFQAPKLAYPRTVRGGGWQDSPDRLRSAARMGSDDEEWKSEDPNVPLSPWWYTTDPARQVGFRLLRSIEVLPKEEMLKFWSYDHEDIQLDVQARLDEGRGAEGLAVPALAEDLKNSN